MKAHHRYAVYGLIIASEEVLVSLDPATEAMGDPAICISFKPTEYFSSVASEVPPDDWVAHSVLSDGSIYLKAQGVFEAIISADGRTVACAALGSVDRRTFEANLMNFVLASALTLQGEEPLHGTVVDLGGRAIGLLGPSGAGKSTLAAFLISRGAGLVTDDILRAEFTEDCLLAHTGPYRLKLFAEPGRRYLPAALADGYFNTLSEKVMVQPDGSRKRRTAAIPLAALFYLGAVPGLEAGRDVASTRLDGLKYASVVMSSAMDYRYNSATRLARQMTFVSRLSRIIAVYHLRYPRTFDVMEAVEAEILRSIGS